MFLAGPERSARGVRQRSVPSFRSRAEEVEPAWCRYCDGSEVAGARIPHMPLILILVILLLVFGGGGYYMGPGVGYYGGGGVSIVLLLVILFLLFGRGRSRL